MSSRRIAALASMIGAWTLAACSPAGLDNCPPEPEETEGRSPGPVVVPRPPVPSLKELGPSARRVKLIVLPSDASVEIDRLPVRRRDGVVEHAGRAGDKFRVRVSRGSWSTEQELTIPSAPSPPIELKLSPPPVLRGKPSDALVSPRSKPEDPLIPEDPLVPLVPDAPK
jgi:hypothetical protein